MQNMVLVTMMFPWSYIQRNESINHIIAYVDIESIVINVYFFQINSKLK